MQVTKYEGIKKSFINNFSIRHWELLGSAGNILLFHWTILMTLMTNFNINVKKWAPTVHKREHQGLNV